MNLDWDRVIKVAVLKNLLEDDTELRPMYAERLAEYIYDNWEIIDGVVAGKVLPEEVKQEVRYVRSC